MIMYDILCNICEREIDLVCDLFEDLIKDGLADQCASVSRLDTEDYGHFHVIEQDRLRILLNPQGCDIRINES